MRQLLLLLIVTLGVATLPSCTESNAIPSTQTVYWYKVQSIKDSTTRIVYVSQSKRITNPVIKPNELLYVSVRNGLVEQPNNQNTNDLMVYRVVEQVK